VKVLHRNLLIVEDEKGIRNLVSMYFKKEGFNIYEAEDGEDAIKMFSQLDIDLVILDIMIPFIDGFKVCRHIREKSSVPVIMLTAKNQEQDMLRGFELGADEYVTKPFSPKVLVARANAVLKRSENDYEKNNTFNLDELSVDFNSGIVSVRGLEVELTKKEYSLLEYLINNKGSILPKESILDRVWGYDYFGDPRTVDTHIKRLREKLGDMSKFIVTVRGRGYKFDVEQVII
jgi:Response regulators consisting of a CheY-like receiver domain and a winged-helix DNA-binding domain